ncbi:MAG TPA: hypothetical protein VH023_19915 [Rhodopila sp.]|jgi:3-oxoacyl-[acyl-carrier-protein] synthase III|nr:hypothetical protein [Rhodopila sp.]
MAPQALSPVNPVGIVAAAYHLPGERRDIVEWGAEQDIPAQLIETLLANGCRYFYASENESDLDLLAVALDGLAAQSGRQRVASATYVLHAHTQNFSVPPAPTSLLAAVAKAYGMQPRLCFSIEQLACSGTVAAIDWATRLLAADPDAEHALVLTSDRVFGNATYRIYHQSGVQSDGASAILLGKTGTTCRIGPITYRNAPELHMGPSTPANERAIAQTSWLHTKRLFQEHQAAIGFPLAEYGQILPINAYRPNWNLIAKALSVPPERLFLDNIRDRGHACCTDLAMNLVDRGFDVLGQGKPVLYCGRSNIGAYAALTLLPPAMAEQPDRSAPEPVTCEVMQ